VPEALEILAQSKFARNAAEEFARFEVEAFWRRCRHAARIMGENRDIVSYIGRRVSPNEVRKQNTNNFCHRILKSFWG